MATKKQKSLSVLIAEVRNTNHYENLKGSHSDLDKKLHNIVNEAEKVNKELDLVHQCLTELYNIDKAVPIIQKTLGKIQELQSQ